MAKRSTTKNVLEGGGGNFLKLKDILVDLRLDGKSEVTKRLRMIGIPIEYREATAHKVDPEDPKKTIAFAFPDGETNKSFTRICDDDPKKDYWTQQGYVINKRFAQVCLERGNDEGEDAVKILTKGKAIFGKFAEREQENKDANKEEGCDLWTLIGGANSPDVKIVASSNKKMLGGVEYKVTFSNKLKPLTEEEIQMLKDVGYPTAELISETMKEIKADDPEFPDLPDYLFYGYNLDDIFKPYVPRETAAATDVDELAVDVSDDEEEEEVAPKKTTKVKAKAKPKDEDEDDEEDGEELPELW